MLTHKVGLPPNHKVPKTHYNFPLYPVMLVVGVSKMMVVSDEVDVEQNNVRKLVPISRMEEVEKCNLCRREDFQIFELTHPRRSKSKKLHFYALFRIFYVRLGEKKKVVTRVYVRVKAKLTLFSFMLTFPFQHTFLSLFS